MNQSKPTQFKTWDEFWGKFLQVDFHLENPERWSFRQKKAEWLIHQTATPPSSAILDLGCGDGILDILLSRMGHRVNAVDRTTTLLQIARNEDDTKNVQFQTNDLMTIDFEKSSFNVAVMIETLGLMSPQNDALLLKRCYDWLGQNGKVVIDIPVEVPKENNWIKTFTYGAAKCFSRFDVKTRLQSIDFQFEENDGTIFGLYDPLDKPRYDGPGICRYLYTKEEMRQLLTQAGFEVTEIPHYYEKDYVAYMGKKK
ncbi:MAG: class I SAM-dependent methyltransferase [Bdellovibrio sp.]|nr:class I SAM-dependent methyltransferase [Bdellovibrio sp.]